MASGFGLWDVRSRVQGRILRFRASGSGFGFRFEVGFRV